MTQEQESFLNIIKNKSKVNIIALKLYNENEPDSLNDKIELVKLNNLNSSDLIKINHDLFLIESISFELINQDGDNTFKYLDIYSHNFETLYFDRNYLVERSKFSIVSDRYFVNTLSNYNHFISTALNLVLTSSPKHRIFIERKDKEGENNVSN